ncbi:MAG: 5'/3'-nucleotidase SurE [Candidatus Tectomicrobia bacterium]|nr:5'/3'-nucleotidase SurE [Candidatus Tectomicrobia bacterium]
MGRIIPTIRRRLNGHQPPRPARVVIGVVSAAWVFAWAVSAGAFNILVTNDDGIHAEGLAVLASELSNVGKVFVVAPDQNRSGSSHSTSIVGQEFTIKRTEKDGRFFGHSVSGTPVDAVTVGVRLLHTDKHFDLLLSGINHGTNVGNIAHYSGTVGAAKEGILLGIPSIAVSQSRRRGEFVTAARFVAQLIDQLKASALPPGVFLTINVPSGKLKGVRVAPMQEFLGRLKFEKRKDSDDIAMYRAGIEVIAPTEPGSDSSAYVNQYITVIPLTVDWNHEATRVQLKSWDLQAPKVE